MEGAEAAEAEAAEAAEALARNGSEVGREVVVGRALSTSPAANIITDKLTFRAYFQSVTDK